MFIEVKNRLYNLDYALRIYVDDETTELVIEMTDRRFHRFKFSNEYKAHFVYNKIRERILKKD